MRTWTAIAVALLAWAPPTVYGGVTQQGWPVVVSLARDGKSVKRIVVALSLSCNSGAPIVNKDRYVRLRLTARGRFRDSYGPVATDDGDGTTTVYRGSIAGTVGRRRVTGTARLTGDVYDARGKLVDTCDSFRVRWTARR